jgi:hypothetical protein
MTLVGVEARAALPTEQFLWFQRRATFGTITASADADRLNFQVGGGVEGFFAAFLADAMRVNRIRSTVRAKHVLLTFWSGQ